MVLREIMLGKETGLAVAGVEQLQVLIEPQQLLAHQLFTQKLEFSCLGMDRQIQKHPKRMGQVDRQITTMDLQKLRETHWVEMVPKVL
jgi:hypothetical protein